MVEQTQPSWSQTLKQALHEGGPLPTNKLVAEKLEATSRLIIPDGYGAVLVAVHDDEPERTAYLSMAPHSRTARKAMENRDRKFYRYCYRRLRLYDALIVDRRERLLPNEWDEQPEQYCLWPDACLAIFIGERSLLNSLKAAVSLHRLLHEDNAKNQLCWWMHLHARVCLGTTFSAALPCLPSAWRGETAIAGDEADSLPTDLLDLAVTAGLLRFGPRAADLAATAAQEPAKA